MRIESPREMERFGANLFYGVQKVFELDSGLERDMKAGPDGIVKPLSYERLNAIEKDMVIVVPMKGEQIKLVQGVLYGIPHPCLVIVVSNSPREPVDRFAIEREAINNYCQYTKNNIVVVHQKDPWMAEAFKEAGYTDLLGKDGLVKNGKAEGMIMGTLLARLTGRKYLGFIDADNYFPGAVLEYVRLYAAGFALSRSDYAMVRIAWHSKPKIVDSELFFAKYGRTSVVTNQFLNDLLSRYTGFETDVLRTGNAGEHALTIDLAGVLRYASGYAVEPYHLINLLEKFGGVIERLSRDEVKRVVEVFQIESRNPHLHAEKGKEHVEQMIFAALKVIYHSPVTPDAVKKDILRELRGRKLIDKKDDVPEGVYYPPLAQINLAAFADKVKERPYARAFDWDSFKGKRTAVKTSGKATPTNGKAARSKTKAK